MIDLSGKVALITGAGRGIGRSCALIMAQQGADVVVNDRPNSPDLAETVALVESFGRKAYPVTANAFTRSGCETILTESLAAAGKIDILVSNPAKSSRSPFLDFDPEEFEATLTATLSAGFHMSQLVARHMVERNEGGKIIFISSVHAQNPYKTAIAYNTAKAGLNHMAMTIAKELIEHHINVNVIEPGWIETPGEYEFSSYEVVQEQGRLLPWGRLGQPADIGHAVAFLASDAADYITATILRVDGGFLHKDL